MPLLNITVSKKITATITIEGTTAALLDRYAAFIHHTADDVIDAALKHVFVHDKAFQKHLGEAPEKQVRASLRVKRSASAAKQGSSAGEVL